jgi:hypothetical protein
MIELIQSDYYEELGKTNFAKDLREENYDDLEWFYEFTHYRIIGGIISGVVGGALEVGDTVGDDVGGVGGIAGATVGNLLGNVGTIA